MNITSVPTRPSGDLCVLEPHSTVPIGSPVSVEIAPMNVLGEPAARMMIIFRSPGCAFDLRPGGGCTFCGFRHMTTHGRPVTPSEYIAQFKSALRGRDVETLGIRQIDFYNSGSFLNNQEVPEEARNALVRLASAVPGVRVLVIESRPEYITRDRVESLRERAGELSLEIGIGFDAYDDVLRERTLKKGITKRGFEAAVERLAGTGARLLAYLMLKPWTMEAEDALVDVRRGAEYIFDTARRYGIDARIALQPTFVVPGTPLAAEFATGRYTPPDLGLVVTATKLIATMGGPVSIGQWDEELNPLAVPRRCDQCQRDVPAALASFNLSQNLSVLDELGGGCRCIRAA